MPGAQNGADLVPVDDNETRGQAIARRRKALGFTSYREWDEASGFDRETLSKAENDEAADWKMDQIEAWLTDKEHEMSMDVPSPESGQVTVEVVGIYGAARVVFKGPSESLPEIEQAIERLLRQHPEARS